MSDLLAIMQEEAYRQCEAAAARNDGALEEIPEVRIVESAWLV